MNPTILTQSGLTFNLVEPDPDLIEIEDIAHALSHICRFTGHTRNFYSVAEHSYIASYLVQPEHALEALLHDAAEAYIGDVSSPLKNLLPDYKAIEQRIELAIRKRFGLPAHQTALVKDADLVMLATERRDLMPANAEAWTLLDGVEPASISLVHPLDSCSAEHCFLSRYAMLTGGSQ